MKDKPAFPGHYSFDGPLEDYVSEMGMTMRQWYKGMAVQGALASGIGVRSNKGHKRHSADAYAEIAAEIADALIAEDKIHERGNG